MSVMRSIRFRFSLLIFILVLAAATVALLLPESARLVGTLVGGVAFGAIGAVIAWWGLGHLQRVAEYVIQLPEGNAPSAPKVSSDEAYSILRGVSELSKERFASAESHRETLLAWQRLLQQLQDPNCPASVTATLETPFVEEQRQVLNLVEEFGKQLFATRQRSALAMRVLGHLPEPVLALDRRGICRYMNSAMERMLGIKQQGQWQRQSFLQFVAQEVPSDEQWHDPEEQPQPAANFKAWLQECKGGSCPIFLVTESKELVPVELVLAPGDLSDGLLALTVHDLRPTRKLLANRLASDRMENFGSFIKNYVSEVEPAIAKVTSQGRLLLSEVKQTSQRNSLVPKVQTLLSEMNQLELIQLLNRFLLWLNEGNLPEPVKTEFEIGDIARLVRDRLTPLMQARESSVEINDQGGWLFGDEDRLTAIFAGMLYHAIRATQNQALTLDLRCSEEVAADGSTFLEATLSPAGQLLEPEQLALLREPFRGLSSGSLWSVGERNGSLLGLLVAERLAAESGGELDLYAGSTGRLTISLRIPSRLPDDQNQHNHDDAIEQLVVAETCAGWRLGENGTPGVSQL